MAKREFLRRISGLMLAFALAISPLFLGCDGASGDKTAVGVNNDGASTQGGFVSVPSGTFKMGSPESEANRSNEETQHEVTISKGFYLGKYEVTQGEFKSVMGTNPSRDSGVGDNYPVYNVRWYDAIAYCNKLSVRDGLTPAYSVSGISDWANLAYSDIPTNWDSDWNAVTWNSDANGYRLPTEAEWEYACRAGTTTAWYTGNTEDDKLKAAAWYYDNSDGMTQPVGEKTPNEYGLYDMHGNVYEWCWDWYDSSYYSSSPSSDPKGASSGTYRVYRGGYWFDGAQLLRSASRNDFEPNTRYVFTGFRLARPQV